MKFLLPVEIPGLLHASGYILLQFAEQNLIRSRDNIILANEGWLFMYCMDATEHSKDNPSTWGGWGRRSALLRASPEPKLVHRFHLLSMLSPPVIAQKNFTCPRSCHWYLTAPIVICYSKLPQHHLQTTVINTAKPTNVLLSKCVPWGFISETLRQRLLQAKRTGRKRNMKEEQPIQGKICC